MSVRDDLIKALEGGDHLGIKRCGWWEVWEAATTWWAPKQKCTVSELISYAKLLGDEDPEKVLEAFRELAGDWRPHPSAVRKFIHHTDADRDRVDVGRGRDRFLTSDAIKAVASALEAGEETCECGGFHGSRYRHDTAGVLRCRNCHGLEAGQVYAVEDVKLSEAGAS